MPGALRSAVDSAGGLLGPSLETHVRLDGDAWVVVGTTVVSHGSSPHNAATMSQGSAYVRINGVAVCAAGDLATCGHAGTPGSSVVRIED